MISTKILFFYYMFSKLIHLNINFNITYKFVVSVRPASFVGECKSARKSLKNYRFTHLLYQRILTLLQMPYVKVMGNVAEHLLHVACNGGVAIRDECGY